MSKEWYYENSGTQEGPISEAALKSMMDQGTLQRNTLIWSEGMTDWCAAEQALPMLFADNQLAVTDAYRASAVSQPALRTEAYAMTPKQILFSFDGRIRRTTFWGYSIGSAAVLLAFALIPMLFFGEDSTISEMVMVILLIPFIWTSLAIRIKRWHDRGKSGWWVWISAIPYIGDIWAFVENGCLEGDYGPNQYGPDPKQGQH